MTVESTVHLPVIWDAMPLMWRHCNEWGKSEGCGSNDWWQKYITKCNSCASFLKCIVFCESFKSPAHFSDQCNSTCFRVVAFVRGTHRSPLNSPHKGQWRGALMLSLICALKKLFSKQSRGWWFETPSRSLWRHCNGLWNSTMGDQNGRFASVASSTHLYHCYMNVCYKLHMQLENMNMLEIRIKIVPFVSSVVSVKLSCEVCTMAVLINIMPLTQSNLNHWSSAQI